MPIRLWRDTNFLENVVTNKSERDGGDFDPCCRYVGHRWRWEGRFEGAEIDFFLWRTAVGILSVREWSATAPHTGDWVYWAGAAKRPEGRFRRLPKSDYRERGRVISLWTLESWFNIEKVKMAVVGGEKWDLKYRIFSIFYPFNSCSHCGCLNYNYCIVELSEIIVFLLLLCKRSHNEVFEGRF